MLHWPDKPRVLVPWNDTLESDEGYHVNPENCPDSPLAWCQEEFRQPFDGYEEDSPKPDAHSISLMIGIWEESYRRLAAVARKYPKKYTVYDTYNAAWLVCGYNTIKETKKAEELAKRIYLSRFS